jgi:hypothetical protein
VKLIALRISASDEPLDVETHSPPQSGMPSSADKRLTTAIQADR